MTTHTLDKYPKLIQDLLQFDNVQQAYPIMQSYEQIVESNVAYTELNLPFSYNVNKMLIEAKNGFADEQDNESGWTGIFLHAPKNISIDDFEQLDCNFDTDYYDVEFGYTNIIDNFPECKKWIDQLKKYIDIQLVEIKKLSAGSYIYPHVDTHFSGIGLRKLYMPLNYPDGNIFRFFKKGEVPFAPGKSFLINAHSTAHYVVNTSNVDRYVIHAHIHNDVDKDEWKTIVEKSYANNLKNGDNNGNI